MRIASIALYDVAIPLQRPMVYPHRTYHELSDTIVRITTDTGLVGWGEVCPLSSSYQPETTEGIRAALGHLAPILIGLDPTQIDLVNDVMDGAVLGERYAKSAIDIACWDIAGKAFDRPVWHLLGGRRQQRGKGYVDLYTGADDSGLANEISEHRHDGFSHFQLKVGKNSSVDRDIDRIRIADEAMQPGDILVVDVNKYWKTHQALRVLRATDAIDYYLEQPCQTYEECLAIRRQVPRPMILDECATDLAVVLRGLADDCFEGLGCKISRVGGITAMRRIRDVCQAAGKVLTIDDSWGADLSAAAQAHLSVSTHPSTFFATYVSTYFSALRYDPAAATIVDGWIEPVDAPGLGVNPDPSILGEPISTFA